MKKIVKLGRGWKTEKWLNQDQEAFCQMYVASDKEFFWNWVQSYIEVYQPATSDKNRYKTACSRASQLLSNVKVIKRINELLEEWWLNDTNVDKQLSFLVAQYDDKNIKLWAIREYNKLKQRIIDRTQVDIVDYSGITDMKELEKLRAQFLS